jgi:hypothetical protein
LLENALMLAESEELVAFLLQPRKKPGVRVEQPGF